MTLFSIVVPVYNIEDYIRRCIESIIIQNFDDYEVLLVNDGSTDDSLSICQEYAEKYKQFSVLTKENGGLSDARNYGIAHAVGKYIVFLDGDDTLEEYALEKLANLIKINQCPSVVLYSANRIKNGRSSVFRHIPFNGVITGSEYLKLKKHNCNYRYEAWLFSIKKDFVKNERLLFKKGLLHEDIPWFFEVMLKADSVAYSDIIFYNYYIRQNSISTKKNKLKNYYDIRLSCAEISHLVKSEVDKRLKKCVEDSLAEIYMNSILVLSPEELSCIEKHGRDFLICKAHKPKTIAKAAIYLISPVIFYKMMKRRQGGV